MKYRFFREMRWMTIWKQGAFLLFIFMISGCATFRSTPHPQPIFYEAQYTLEDYNNDLSAYKSSTSVGRISYRNKIVFLVAAEIDKNYAAFKNSFFVERATTETLLDIAQIGLTSAVTLAGGAPTKAILGAIATGVSGSRLSFNKNFFKEKSLDLLLSRMDALRTEMWSQIYLKLKGPGSTDETYSLYEAERDLVAYYQAGSLQMAFQDIIAESGATQKKSETQIREQIKQQFNLQTRPQKDGKIKIDILQ
jgi:hypothetical protein